MVDLLWVFFHVEVISGGQIGLGKKAVSHHPTQSTTEPSEKPVIKEKGLLKLHFWQSCDFTTNIYTMF